VCPQCARRGSSWPRGWGGSRSLDLQSVIDGTTLTVTCRAAFGLMPSRMPRAGGIAVRLRRHPGALACKSWAGRVAQCVRDVRPRRIFGGDLGLSAVVVGPLLNDCYMMVALADDSVVVSDTSIPSLTRWQLGFYSSSDSMLTNSGVKAETGSQSQLRS
jgi:hypothetical protein